MHKGRYYPQTKNRWKCPDGNGHLSIPRQAHLYAGDFGFPFGEPIYEGWSYPCADTTDDLIEYYPFQRLIELDRTMDIEQWWDGTNELEFRGVWSDNFDQDGGETLQFFLWPADQYAFQIGFVPLEWTDYSPGPPESQWEATCMTGVDWYSYPIGPGWAPFSSALAREPAAAAVNAKRKPVGQAAYRRGREYWNDGWRRRAEAKKARLDLSGKKQVDP